MKFRGNARHPSSLPNQQPPPPPPGPAVPDVLPEASRGGEDGPITPRVPSDSAQRRPIHGVALGRGSGGHAASPHRRAAAQPSLDGSAAVTGSRGGLGAESPGDAKPIPAGGRSNARVPRAALHACAVESADWEILESGKIQVDMAEGHPTRSLRFRRKSQISRDRCTTSLCRRRHCTR